MMLTPSDVRILSNFSVKNTPQNVLSIEALCEDNNGDADGARGDDTAEQVLDRAKDPNPLTEDLHQAVKNLSAELYAKDVHFLMELIQNAEDNEYEDGVDPSLQFVITSKDITGTGASSTLLIFNNEKGFSRKNIESICSVGRSTKKNHRKRGYIGEKGIGFKSVFLITSRPYIFSNGYQIRFDESPCPACDVGYIVPEWVDSNPIISEIKLIHGPNITLPATTIVLPLKPDKVGPVKKQLSSVHPELLLFLSKIKKLSVREEGSSGPTAALTAISISSETNFVTRKNVDAESFLLHLSADAGPECSYHMWRQRFPARPENRVERRSDVEEFSITLAFPNGERPHADFLLASSRETILLDSPWNRAILECVPSAFTNAFISLVKENGDAPISNLPRMFGFLPVDSSPYPLLNSFVREAIRSKLMGESIIPCESYTQQRFFHRPGEVGRLRPTFWNLLKKARDEGVCLDNISTHGKYILSSAFDNEECDSFLNFLKVGPVDDDWYAKCVRSLNLVLGGSEGLYLEFLLFAAENWRAFSSTSFVDVPLIKYVGQQSQVSLISPGTANRASRQQEILFLSKSPGQITWLVDWNGEFVSVHDRFFLPESTQREICFHPKRQTICDWLLEQLGINCVTVYDYALQLAKSISKRKRREHAVTYAHFLYHSTVKKYLSTTEADHAASCMPLVNNYGQVTLSRQGVIVPASGSRWVQLVGFNPWKNEGYVELGEDYLHSGNYAGGVVTREKELTRFLESYVKASDVPDLPPPDEDIPSFYSSLTKQNALLLLQWVHNLRVKKTRLPNKFLNCVKNGNWLRVLLGASVTFKPPSQSFLLTSSCECLNKYGSVIVDIPFVDQSFYGNKLSEYHEELRHVGVMSEFKDACEYIGNHLMSVAASSALTRAHVFSILNFIRFLRDKLLPPDGFINSIKEKKWLRTSQGERSPRESVLYDPEWEAASHISEIPFIDQNYYGTEINSHGKELQLLGVLVGFRANYKLVHDKLKSPSGHYSYQAAMDILLLLECLRHYSSSEKLLGILKDSTLLKTNKGFKSPAECYLFDPTWGCLLQVFNNTFALVDTQYYGDEILSFTNELAGIGVLVSFEEAAKAFARVFRQQASLSAISRDNVLSFLACCRKFKLAGLKFHKDVKSCIAEAKWLRTRLTDYRPPKQCILFGPEWAPISSISILPFIDENYYEYKNELQALGVIVSFKSGAKFVASSLRLPQDPSGITAAAAYSLFECIRNLLTNLDEPSLIENLVRKSARAWIKTRAGYRAPNECLLFGPSWDSSSLSREDGPFIDETFYGPGIRSYSKELNALGVVVEKENGCSLLASHMESHAKDFAAIKRIYSFLNESKWRAPVKNAVKIWVPVGSDGGKWVTSEECVVHDKDGLFGGKFYVLDTFYEKELLTFFSCKLEVKQSPCIDDYRDLWIDWEKKYSSRPLESSECLAFWSYVARHWGPKAREALSESFQKLPVFCGSGGGILLVDKRDVFIPDDLYLKDLFESSASSRPLFAWWPRPSSKYLPRNKLLDIFGKIGARNLSESVERVEDSSTRVWPAAQESSGEAFVRKRGFVKLILGFLAGLEIEPDERHSAVKNLLEATVIETPSPITIEYRLRLKSGEVVSAGARGLMRWERDTCRFFMHGSGGSGGFKNILERGICFARVVSKGLMWDKEDEIGPLVELVELGFLLEFDEAAVEFLMKTKNLQIFLEDEEFLSPALPSCLVRVFTSLNV
ncbi:DNA binding [Striga asiatica]|uniref:DNA binding n=1 Tax=Striga asiatica TaxID=4170 RepID=A0A5A7QS66_STRAF|nr:DNA binding [Striga asiatica]